MRQADSSAHVVRELRHIQGARAHRCSGKTEQARKKAKGKRVEGTRARDAGRGGYGRALKVTFNI